MNLESQVKGPPCYAVPIPSMSPDMQKAIIHKDGEETMYIVDVPKDKTDRTSVPLY